MADTPATTPEAVKGTPEERFLNSLGITLLGSPLEFADLAKAELEGKRDAKLAELIGRRTPEQLINAIEAADPDNKPFLDSIRSNPELMASIHNAVSKDPSVLKGLQTLDGEGGMDAAKLQAVITDSSVSSTFTALFNKIAEKPDDEYSFDTVKGLIVKMENGDLAGANADLATMGISEIEISGSLATKLLTPDELLAKIGEGAGIEIPEAALNDKDFKEALHRAVANDPTVMEGLLGVKDDGTTAFAPDDLKEMLADDRNRGILTNVLDVVAKSDNDKFNFKYMTDFAKAAKEKDMVKLRQMFEEMDIDFPAMSTDEMLQALGDFFKDPVGFAPKFVEMMGVDPLSEQGKALSASFATMGSFVEMIIGGETGYRAVAMEYGPGLFRDGQKFVDDISGETDKKIRLAETSDPIVDGPAPTYEDLKKFIGTGTVAAANQVEEQLKLFENGKPVLKTASLDVTVGNNPYMSQNNVFAGPATGIVPPEQINEFGNDMRRKVGNNDMSFSLVG